MENPLLKVDLYGTALVLEEFGNIIARGGSGLVIASQSGHRLPPLGVEQNHAASQPAFYHNVHIGGGPAAVRAYIGELLPDILEGKIRPGRVFDRVVNLDEVLEGYRAMNERESIKVLVQP